MESSRARVLVAEDSRTQRAYFADLLRAEGLDVHEAHDGRVALDLCRIIHPDLLILDLGLPRLSGEEVLERLRADRKIRATPVVVLTADERDATVAAVLDAGATDFLVKPVHASELLARVRRVLRESANVDRLLDRNRVLAEAAEIDALTGLPNRRASAEALSAAAASRANPVGRSLSRSSMSTASSRSTTSTVMQPAIRCSARSPAGSAITLERSTSSAAGVVRSSSPCCPMPDQTLPPPPRRRFVTRAPPRQSSSGRSLYRSRSVSAGRVGPGQRPSSSSSSPTWRSTRPKPVVATASALRPSDVHRAARMRHFDRCAETVAAPGTAVSGPMGRLLPGAVTVVDHVQASRVHRAVRLPLRF